MKIIQTLTLVCFISLTLLMKRREDKKIRILTDINSLLAAQLKYAQSKDVSANISKLQSERANSKNYVTGV